MGGWRDTLKEPVVDVEIYEDMTLGEFVGALEKIHGFMAGHVAEASKLFAKMILDAKTVKFLSFTGNLVSTGLRGVIAQMIREGAVDVVITTCGAVDHDVARAVGGLYYRGLFDADDAQLSRDKIHRLGNVFIPWENYGEKVEGFVRELVERLVSVKSEWGVREILQEAGRLIQDRNSILKVAAERKVPVYVPGIVDGAFGTQLWIASQFHKLQLNLFRDMKELADIVFSAEKAGALIVGGGISKHHLIWWNQFRGGLDYAIYVTTAVEYDGSLSGARPREAISWGKLKEGAKRVVVYCDATVALPIIWAGARRAVREVVRQG